MKRRTLLLLSVLVVVVAVASVSAYLLMPKSDQGAGSNQTSSNRIAVMETSKGTMEFVLYEVLSRKRAGVNVYAVKPFYDLFHRRFYNEDETVHSARYPRSNTLSLPYFKVEYSFDIWGETYYYSLDALFNPEIRLETRRVRPLGSTGKGKSVLVHVLDFKPPHPKTLHLDLPPSILLFDVSQKIQP